MEASTGRRRPGRPRSPVVDRPPRLVEPDHDPREFHLALDLQMRCHGDNVWRLLKAINAREKLADRKSLTAWRKGTAAPRSGLSMRAVALIEARYQLPGGSLRAKLLKNRAVAGEGREGISRAEGRRLAWHLPDDFGRRSAAERAEILDWVRTAVLGGGTAYGRFHARVSRDRFSIRFDQAKDSRRRAPAALAAEVADLVRFKTATLTDPGKQRSGVWNAESVDQRLEHLGLMFGALAADPSSNIRGAGVPKDALCAALLVIPAVWDWYLCWREARRGFYTGWEVDMLLLVAGLTRTRVGWLRQNPEVAKRLAPISGLVTADDVEQALTDWDGTCERLHQHALGRAREIKRVARVHRDPFEPLLPVLEAESPVGEYRKITEEIVARMPDARRYPRAAAEAVRSLLMLRFGLHSGLRQKNLRQLLFRNRPQAPSSERELDALKRGELRWNAREGGWEIFIPCSAFKNAKSAYFGKRPYRLILPDLGDLYHWIDVYLGRHRSELLRNATDPGTFFVKTVKRNTTDASYNQATFYEAWRLTVQRYGIYNPYTGRGAIKGLLSHGPHSVRDVIATHILKQTGSYEQASYAIQDTPATVAAHYGRFLPQDKTALAASLLNQAWAAR